MKLVYAINNTKTANPAFNKYLEVAVFTAQQVGYDDILLLYDGEKPEIDCPKFKCRSRFADQMIDQLATDKLPMGLGTMLRLEIPWILQEEYVLYCDIDVIHYKRMEDDEMPHPAYWAMCYEHCPTDLIFNAGITVMNLPNLRDMDFNKYVKEHLVEAAQVSHDQWLINKYYKDRITQLHPKWNYRPYWKQKTFQDNFPELRTEANILHLHGPKPLDEPSFTNNFPDILRPQEFYNDADRWKKIYNDYSFGRPASVSRQNASYESPSPG